MPRQRKTHRHPDWIQAARHRIGDDAVYGQTACGLDAAPEVDIIPDLNTLEGVTCLRCINSFHGM